MDFDYTPQEEAFRHELRAWLLANPPRATTLSRFCIWIKTHVLPPARLAKAIAPRRLGGHPLAESLRRSWCDRNGANDLSARDGAGADARDRELHGHPHCRPTLIHWGTEEQKQRYIPTILNGEEIWCQGYSEPGAGSDIASLQTRAVEEGDDFVINGQKVWTSYAQYAQFCLLLARTDPAAPKHKGISCFIVDMRTPGITVRPLRQINGDAEFNEVFFDNVRVPKRNLIGEKNQGWQVTLTTLMFERVTFDVLSPVEAVLERLVNVVKRAATDASVVGIDSSVRQQVARFYTELQAIKYSSLRQLTRQLRGEPPGPESSLVKLAASELNQRVVQFATAFLGASGQFVSGSKQGIDGGYWMHCALSTHLYTIAGGTSEIQRTILGERVLNLPKG